MESILRDIDNTFHSSDNVMSTDNLSIEIPFTIHNNSDHADKFMIDMLHLAVDMLGGNEPSTCINALSVIIKLNRNQSDVIRDEFYSHDAVHQLLFWGVTEMLDYRNSTVDEVAQNDEYIKAFDGFIPEGLRGFELVWRYIFDFHYSFTKENREICRLGCEALYAMLQLVINDRERNDEHSECNLMEILTEDTFVQAISSMMGTMLKYGSDDDIMSNGTAGICMAVSCIDRSYMYRADGPDEDNEELQILLKSLQVVTQTVRSHMGSPEFITDFCNVICTLAYDSTVFHFMAHPTLSLSDTFVDILREYHQDPTVTYLTLKIISYFMDTIKTYTRNRITSASLVGTVVAAINLHVLNITLVITACNVIRTLSVQRPNTRVLLGAAGACEAVVRAFSKHSEAFRQYGECRPLVRALAYGNLENKNKLLYLGAGDWVPQLNVSGWLDGDEIEQGGDY